MKITQFQGNSKRWWVEFLSEKWNEIICKLGKYNFKWKNIKMYIQNFWRLFHSKQFELSFHIDLSHLYIKFFLLHYSLNFSIFFSLFTHDDKLCWSLFMIISLSMLLYYLMIYIKFHCFTFILIFNGLIINS